MYLEQYVFSEYDIRESEDPLFPKDLRQIWLGYLKTYSPDIEQSEVVKNITLSQIESSSVNEKDPKPIDEQNTKNTGVYTEAETYHPEKISNLFLRFAEIELNNKSILNFVRKKGLLGSIQIDKKIPNLHPEFGITDILVNLLGSWYFEIINIKSLINNYQLYKQKKYKILFEKFKCYQADSDINWEFTETDHSYFNKYCNFKIKFTKNIELCNSKNKKEVKIDVKNIHKIMSEYFSRVLNIFSNNRMQTVHASSNGWFRKKQMPNSLIGVVWNQLSEIMKDKENTIKNCLYHKCPKFFVVGSGEKRKSRKYCSSIHASLYHKINALEQKVIKLFKKNSQHTLATNSFFNLIIINPNNRDELAGIYISYSSTLGSKSKKWKYMLNKIKENMNKEGFENAYFINSNLDIYFIDLRIIDTINLRKKVTFEKIKKPINLETLAPKLKIKDLFIDTIVETLPLDEEEVA